MKRFFSALLAAGVLSAPAYADCRYFRVSTKLTHCGPADTKALDAANPYEAIGDVPELHDARVTALVQVTCDCDYSLSGSDPRCDVDMSVEKSAIASADDPDHSCRRGTSLCHDVCPTHLP